jgi:hypothetical protein
VLRRSDKYGENYVIRSFMIVLFVRCYSIKVIKSRRLRWAGACRHGRYENAQTFKSESLKGR